MEDINSIFNKKELINRDIKRFTLKNGFTQFMNNLLLRKDIDTYEKLILICLIMHQMHKEVCFPSEKTLAIECSCGVSTIKKRIKSLEEKGLIKIERRHQKSNRYTTHNQFKVKRINKIDIV